MRLFELSSIASAFLLITPTLARIPYGFNHAGPQDQLPIVESDCPTTTKTKFLTRTHFEVNVVSTVYRTRTHTHEPAATKAAYEAEAHTLVFGAEGTGCDAKACTICRLLNNCSHDSDECPACDVAYYCNQCGPEEKLTIIGIHAANTRRTCSVGPGQTVPCEMSAIRREVFEIGG